MLKCTVQREARVLILAFSMTSYACVPSKNMSHISIQVAFHPSLPMQPRLVLPSCRLASLELLEIPVADLHVAALLVHALGELLSCALAVVAPLLLLL